MKSQTRQQNILDFLHSRGSKGATVIELMLSGGGSDARKRISELRRDGYVITDKWEKKGTDQKYKRYFWEE